MDFLELVQKRYSVRKFSDQAVEQQQLEQILMAGLAAPTACNNQPQRVLVINSKEGLANLRKCTACHFHAPAALLVCFNRNECWQRASDGKTSGDIDASIVTTHMMLEAASLGIGSTWVMSFAPDILRREFMIPDDIIPVALLVIGYPAADAGPAPQHLKCRPQDELIKYNRF